jgi:hypothetical protein
MKGARRTPDGQVVAAFAVSSHFDIRRDYNPSTGEESNVIVENTTDRAWYDRAYFRVDWSRNLVTDAYDLDTLSQLGIYYGVTWDPVAYYVNDPVHPDAPVFDLTRGYFDVTHKALAAPEVIEDPEWGDFPACWLIGQFPTLSCNPSEITLRQAFLKVTDTDYEPLVIDGTMMDMFGYFTWDRFGYDRRYGVVDDLWRRFATRWNLFERSHAEGPIVCNTPETTKIGQDPNRDDDKNGTEDECESVGNGSRCDAVVGECTLPLMARKVKTIPWHVNQEFPEELFDGTKEALQSWNQAVRVGVLAGRLAECRRTGGSDCEGQLGWPQPWFDDFAPPVGDASPAEVPEIFVLCHNPVDPEKGDPEACGPAGTSPRLGDLRYNLMTIVTDVEFMAPWGIMMDAEDPLTGEKIAGSVNQWAFVLDRYSSTLVDIVGLINGDIDPEEFLAGENVSDWVAANGPGGAAERFKAMPADEIQRRRAAFDPDVMTPYFANMPQLPEHIPPPGKRAIRHEQLLEQGRLGPGNGELSARLALFRDTPLEAALASPEMVQAVGYDPTAPPSTEAIVRSSPFRRNNPTVRRSLERARMIGNANRHSCRREAPEADHLLGMAKVAAQLFPSPDPNDAEAVAAHRKALFEWARAENSKGVMAHEIGHSMGLRHNFAASFDSLNYDRRYWQLRTKDGTVTADCQDGETSGENCIGPRWRDPVTQGEIDGNISKWSTTSVMDYPGDQNQDQLVAGSYDRAAVRFGYGGTVDVWAEQGLSVAEGSPGQAKAFELSSFTTSPGLFGVLYFNPVDPEAPYVFRHYTEYQREFGVLGACAPSGEADAVNGTKCSGAPMDVVDYRDMSDFAPIPDYAKFTWGVQAKTTDPSGRVRRGYMFSSDEYADSGNVPSFSDDAGADAYEQIRFLEAAYENRYIFDSFRRNRVQFNSWDSTARVQARYLDNLQLIAKAFFFGAVLEGDPTAPTEEFLADGNFGPLAMGSTLAFDLFARQLTRPDPGYYCSADVCGVQPWGVEDVVYASDPAPLPELYLYDFSVALGDGRYLHNDYDYSQGYFWGDYQTQVGSYYDKVWAVYYLAEAFDSFISNSKEDFVDSRYKNVNFATVYPRQMQRLFGALLTGDYATYAPWASPPANPEDTPPITLEYPFWSDPFDIGTRPNNSLLVDPSYGWNTQINAMVWGTMFFTTNWSTSFVHDARIVVLGGEDPQWPEPEILRFRDPKSGLVYMARKAGTENMLGKTVQIGTGARVLEWANHLLATGYQVVRDIDGAPVLAADGTPTLILDANGLPQREPSAPGADVELSRYVDTIDLYRQLINTFEHPLEYLPEP